MLIGNIKKFLMYIFLIEILQNLGGDIGEGHGWTDGWTLIGHKYVLQPLYIFIYKTVIDTFTKCPTCCFGREEINICLQKKKTK